MKIAGSYCCSAMSCIVFVVTYVIVVFVTTTWADCKTDCKFGTYGSRVHKRVYPIYKRLESIMINDTETLYQMREAFFPKLVRWSRESDPVNTVHIRVCGTLNETSRPPPTCNYNLKTRCWNLRWSSSPALNMISVDQLLAFDPVFPALVYSAIVGSPSQRSFLFIFPMSSDLFPCTPSESDLTQAVVLLSSWSKAYAKAQGLPTTWSQEDQGYIARWYSYYTAEGYESDIILGIRKLLLAVFILLNLLVLHVNITVGRKWYYRFYSILKESSEQASRIYLAAGITTAVLNVLYLTLTVVLYTKYNQPPINGATCTALTELVALNPLLFDCSPPHSSTLYKDQVTSFIVKVVVLLTAIITALPVAITSTMKSTLPTVGRCSKCLRYARIVLLWNYLVFVQIWAGLISLPFCIFLIISPLETISTLCATVLTILLFSMLVVCLLQLGDIQVRMCNYKNNSKVCAHFSRCLIVVALFGTLIILYFWLSPTSELSGIRKVLYSLLLPTVLSVTAWVVKRRFLTKNTEKRNKTERKPSVESTSTEEYLQDIEQNGNRVRSDEAQRNLLTEELLNTDIV